MRTQVLCLYAVGVALSYACVTDAAQPAGKPSVLFVNIDDLNDWNEVLGGHPQAITPSLKKLAARGTTFTRTTCSSPVCFPSRTALFSGVHPSRSGAISNFNWGKPWRFYVPGVTTLPKHVERHGWKTAAAGKNFHGDHKAEFARYFGRPREVKAIKGSGYMAGPLGWGVASVPYEQMPDHRVVSWGIERVKETDEPLFLAIGIYRPHVPWILPQSSFDKYPLDQFEEPEKIADDLADVAPRLRLLAHNEAKFDAGYHQKLKRDGQVKAWARAYMASATFADEQLGRLIAAWDASGHAGNGYIVLWSDHGFMLGEKEGWGKFKPWYDACHSNLIIVGPGVQRGAVCDKAVSLQDLYPTLVELLDLPRPGSHQLDGHSLLPLLRNPHAPWDKPVVMSHEEDGVRYDVVLDNRYRMTRLITGETELYDHRTDPHEWHNLAGKPAYAPVIERLSKHLTFDHPTVPDDGWLEAEALPAQTSADFGRRGNFHYRVKDAKASGGELVHAHLKMKAGSYIDFVVDVTTPGTYELVAVVQHLSQSMVVSVLVDDVTEHASQATSDHPMTELPIQVTGKGKTKLTLEQVGLGTVTFDRPGLKLIRFMSDSNRPEQLRVDRIRLKR